jgi:hypothetical protein
MQIFLLLTLAQPFLGAPEVERLASQIRLGARVQVVSHRERALQWQVGALGGIDRRGENLIVKVKGIPRDVPIATIITFRKIPASERIRGQIRSAGEVALMIALAPILVPYVLIAIGGPNGPSFP